MIGGELSLLESVRDHIRMRQRNLDPRFQRLTGTLSFRQEIGER